MAVDAEKLKALSAAFAEGAEFDDDRALEDDLDDNVTDNGRFACDFLINKTETNIDNLNKYIDLLKEQLLDGEGEAFVDVGANFDGSVTTGLSKEDLKKAVDANSEVIKALDCQQFPLSVAAKDNNLFTQCMFIRKNIEEKDFIEARIAVVGNVDAGKSTLLGVLTHNTLDDGRGLARRCLFRHKHEFESGRTSSVGNDILGFDMAGQIVNKPNPHNGELHWPSVCSDASKVVTFIDLAGHERYLKTTIFGMTGHMPDYAMLMVGSNAGIIGTTREHFLVALNLNIPVFVVVTKIDMCPENILDGNMKMIEKLMRSGGSGKFPYLVRNEDDITHVIRNFALGKMCPIFKVSNVNGTNLDLLRKFLNYVPLRRGHDTEAPAEFHIDETFSVEGVGTVVSGTCVAGTIRLGDELLIGPDACGNFVPFPVKSIHRKRVPVEIIKAGQTASFSAKKFGRRDVRKGMVLVSPRLDPQACLKLDVEVYILHHPTTIVARYQAMVHAGAVRQTATIIRMDKKTLRTGDRANVTLKFIRNPEYVRDGTRIIFREGKTKAVGIVRHTHPLESSVPKKPKAAKKNHQKTASTFVPLKNNKVNKQKGTHKH